MRLKATNQVEDNKSVKMFHYSRERCMFDHGSDSPMKERSPSSTAPRGVRPPSEKGKWEEATGESWLARTTSPSHLFQHTANMAILCLQKKKSNGWRRDKPAAVVSRFTKSARACSLTARSLQAAAGREPQTCLRYCWMATGSLVFWLWAGRKKRKKKHRLLCAKFLSPSLFLCTSLNCNVTEDSCLREHYLYNLKKSNVSKG